MDETIQPIEYESLFDEALDMARTLQDIEEVLRIGVQCEGDYDGGIPASDTLAQLCKIMYKDHGYFRNEKYRRMRKA